MKQLHDCPPIQPGEQDNSSVRRAQCRNARISSTHCSADESVESSGENATEYSEETNTDCTASYQPLREWSTGYAVPSLYLLQRGTGHD